jgi:hypothetical protein
VSVFGPSSVTPVVGVTFTLADGGGSGPQITWSCLVGCCMTWTATEPPAPGAGVPVPVSHAWLYDVMGGLILFATAVIIDLTVRWCRSEP